MTYHKSSTLVGPESDDDFIPKQSFGTILFNKLKARNPSDIINIDAVTKETLTCGKLLTKSVKLAVVLKDLGVQKGYVMSIIQETSVNYVTFIAAGLYLGVAVNPINPDCSLGELRHCFSISKPQFVLCSESSLEQVLKLAGYFTFIKKILLVGSTSRTHCSIQNIEELILKCTADINKFNPMDVDYKQHIAIITYSSGTTGLPKGVMITHENLRTPLLLFGHPMFGHITENDTTVLIVPMYHVFGPMMEILTVISSMKKILLKKFDPNVFLKCIEKYNATKLFLVPPLVLFLARSRLVDDYNLSSVKDIYVGAAPLSQALIDETTQRLGVVTIRQNYGLTETCGPCVFQVDNNKHGSVGTLTFDMSAKIWNLETKLVVRPHEVGELCLKGPALMKGYIPDQNYIDEEGFFHTGDAAYYDEDGYLYIVDRIKEIIKYKGFQVSPAELEALILTHSKIKDCGVIGIPNERTGEVPLAFVVAKEHETVGEIEIVDYVAENICVQKRLHGGVIIVDEIPKNPVGKIVRQKLKDMYAKFSNS